MTKQDLALEVIRRLKKEYPDADCTLDYDDAWKLLVSVRLAAQCTDARVNVVVQDLYARYPDVAALAEATPEEIEEIVRPCGLGTIQRQSTGRFQCPAEASGGRKKKCQPDHGRCIRQTGNRDRHSLYPSVQSDRAGP